MRKEPCRLNLTVVGQDEQRNRLRLAVELDYCVVNIWGDKVVNGLPVFDALAYVGATNGVEASVDEMHVGGHGGFVNGKPHAWIDRNFVVGENVVRLGPSVERQPVVCTDDENEFPVRIIGCKMFKGVAHVGRLGEVELIVGGHETCLALERFPGEVQAQIVIEKVVGSSLERVEWGDDKPYFVECGLPQNLSCQFDMAVVDGIEAAAEDARALFQRVRTGRNNVILV
jgi:hypothetical protein